MADYIGPIVSLVIVGIGGAVIKIFIDRAFKSIDESIKSLFDSQKTVNKEQEELWDYANEIHEDIIRLQAALRDTSKISDLRLEFLEKFQTNNAAESDFNRLLSLLDSLSSKFEKLEEKIFKRRDDD